MARSQMNKEKVCIYMFEEDFKRITRWVLQFPDLETGGSLFGLWKSEENPVAHFVLGPGKSCKRTNVSFFQDVSYLEKVGNVLTHDYMLCHVGEWHSHHRLSLDKPSSGDVGTVVRNYPRGACGFILIIANIVSQGAVSLSPYLFTEETCRKTFGSKYKTGEIIFIPGVSPFQELTPLSNNVLEGEEKYFGPFIGAQTTENRKKAEKGNESFWPDNGKSKEKQHSLKLNNKYSSVGATGSHTLPELTTRSVGSHNVATASISRQNPENNVGMVVPRPPKQKAIPQLANIESPLAAGTHVQPGLKHSANGEYCFLPTVSTSTYYQTNANTFPSSSTPQESVLQKAGLDPPGGLNHATAGLSEQNKTRPEAAGFGSNSNYLPVNMRTNESKKTNLNFVEHSGHFQPPGSDPLGATDLSVTSSTDSIYVMSYQWYSTSQGQNDLKLLVSLLSEVAEGDIEMTRNQYTHNIKMKFLRHGTKWIIELSSRFPQMGTKLKKEVYSIQGKKYYNETVKVISNTTLREIVKEVTDEVGHLAPNVLRVEPQTFGLDTKN